MHQQYAKEMNNENLLFSIRKLSSFPKAKFHISTLKCQISGTLISTSLLTKSLFLCQWILKLLINGQRIVTLSFLPWPTTTSMLPYKGPLQTVSARYLLYLKELFCRHTGLCTYYNKTSIFYTQYPPIEISKG